MTDQARQIRKATFVVQQTIVATGGVVTLTTQHSDGNATQDIFPADAARQLGELLIEASRHAPDQIFDVVITPNWKEEDAK